MFVLFSLAVLFLLLFCFENIGLFFEPLSTSPFILQHVKVALHLSLFAKNGLTQILVANIDEKQLTRKSSINIDSHLRLSTIIQCSECINTDKARTFVKVDSTYYFVYMIIK